MPESLKEILARIGSRMNAEDAPDPDQEYDCRKCGNWRWLEPATPGASMAPCDCQEIVWRTSSRDRHLRYSLLPETARKTLRDTLPDGPDERVDPASFRNAYEAIAKFAKKPAGWLLLKGPVGSGKTHLAMAAVLECIEHGSPARFEHVPKLIDELRQGQTFGDQPDAGTYRERLEQAIVAPVLVLDDIGAHTTEWGANQIDMIVQERLRQMLPTLATMDTGAEASSQRIAARLDHTPQVRAITIAPGLQAIPLPPDLSLSMIKRMTFVAFKPAGRHGKKSRPSLAHAKADALNFANHPSGWLYINGPTGVGKTHLAVAIAGTRMSASEKVTFYSYSTLMHRLRSSHDRTAKQRPGKDLLEQVKAADLLILDDFGSLAPTPWIEQTVYQIVSHRHHHELPTVFTSRGTLDPPRSGGRGEAKPGSLHAMLSTAAASPAAEAVCSRLMDKKLVDEVEIDAPDYRTAAEAKR